MLGAARVQIPEKNLDNLHSSKEEDETLEIVDPQDLLGKVFTNIGYTWRPSGRTFTVVRNACPLTRITTTTKVPSRKPIAVEIDTPKPVVTLVYSRKPRKSKSTDLISKSMVIKSVHANKKE
nr:hypothetical protein [Tanacetum cinerariifolium]